MTYQPKANLEKNNVHPTDESLSHDMEANGAHIPIYMLNHDPHGIMWMYTHPIKLAPRCIDFKFHVPKWIRYNPSSMCECMCMF